MTDLTGIFGGTFDPPHLGHLILASEMLEQLHLTRLLWVLTPDPPHKQDVYITPMAHRLAMTRLALEEYPQFELSTIEIDRPGPHYTLDTVRMIGELYPATGVVLLLGGDSLQNLPTWNRPADLVAACRLIGVMHRPGDSVDLRALEQVIPGLNEKVEFVDAPLLEIASRDIRRRAAEGRSFKHYLPTKVYDYIVENKVYT